MREWPPTFKKSTSIIFATVSTHLGRKDAGFDHPYQVE